MRLINFFSILLESAGLTNWLIKIMSDVPMAFGGKFEEQLATKLVLLPVLVQVIRVGVGDGRCHGGAG